MNHNAKPLNWVGSSRDDIRAFPQDARQKAGRELRWLQLEQLPHDWKPMKTVGPGVGEIRVHSQVEHRVIYIARFEEAFMSYTRFRSAPARRPKATSKSRGGVSRHSSASAKPVRHEPASDEARMTPSSGNVFLDLGFPPEEAQSLLIRTDLMIQIEQLIRRRKLTQAKAAKLFGVTQPRISDLVRGRIDRFSIDSLIAMLERAGAKIEVKVRAA